MSQPPVPQRPKSSRTMPPPSKSMVWSLMLASVLIVGGPLCLLVWAVFEVWGNEDVVSSQSLGRFIHMGATASWSGSVVIQTEHGFLPLYKTVLIPAGTPLVLELRGSGRRYVCDGARTLCVETTKEGFNRNRDAAGGRP